VFQADQQIAHSLNVVGWVV